MVKLGVNIDHSATLRQVRYRGMESLGEPDILEIARRCEAAGADGITAHLREDRRHIVDVDIPRLKEGIATRLNLEMANTPEMVDLAEKILPAYVCLVPEKRAELTTEGGLNVLAELASITTTCDRLQASGNIQVSCFVDADPDQIRAVADTGAKVVEIHTGPYAEHFSDPGARNRELQRIVQSAELAASLGLVVNAGHGLNYLNTAELLRAYPDFFELNIGHSIICRALLDGISKAVQDMKSILAAI